MSSSDHPQECAACHAPAAALTRFEPGFDARGVALYSCDECTSITMWPQPAKDYTAHTSESEALRDYVEMNCSVHDIAKAVMPAVYAGTPSRYLDVGCGFGFSLDIVRRLTRAEVLGVEPAHYGQRGRELLGIPVLPKILEGGPEDQSEDVLKERFDVVFSSEVIEHVTDPDRFVATLKRFLTPGGILALTTPRAGALRETHPTNEKLAVVSPGAHVFLYSREAMMAALHRAGFDHVEVKEFGVTQIAYASERPLAIPGIDAGIATMQYLQLALAEGSPEEPVRTGLQYRLYRNLVERADWDGASALDEEIDFVQAPDPVRFDNYVDFLKTYRACDPSLCYLRGMLWLNHRRKFAEAHEWFMSAFRFCSEKLRIAPGAAVVEADLVWRALFHAALAAKYAKKTTLMRETWDIAEKAQALDYLPAMPEDIRNRLERDLGADFVAA